MISTKKFLYKIIELLGKALPSGTYIESDGTALEIGTVDSSNNKTEALSVGYDGYVSTAKDELITSTSRLAEIMSAGSGITISEIKYVRRGNVAQIYGEWTSSSAITVRADGNLPDVTVGTLVSGKRPVIETVALSHGNDNGTVYYISSAGNIALTAANATGSQRTIAAGTAMNFRATYIVE